MRPPLVLMVAVAAGAGLLAGAVSVVPPRTLEAQDERVWISRVQEHMQGRRLEAAAAAGRDALKQHPDSVSLLSLLASALLAMEPQQAKEALAALERARDLWVQPGARPYRLFALYNNLALAYRLTGNVAAAAAAERQYYDLPPAPEALAEAEQQRVIKVPVKGEPEPLELQLSPVEKRAQDLVSDLGQPSDVAGLLKPLFAKSESHDEAAAVTRLALRRWPSSVSLRIDVAEVIMDYAPQLSLNAVAVLDEARKIWRVSGGRHLELYATLIKAYAKTSNVAMAEATLSEYETYPLVPVDLSSFVPASKPAGYAVVVTLSNQRLGDAAALLEGLRASMATADAALGALSQLVVVCRPSSAMAACLANADGDTIEVAADATSGEARALGAQRAFELGADAILFVDGWTLVDDYMVKAFMAPLWEGETLHTFAHKVVVQGPDGAAMDHGSSSTLVDMLVSPLAIQRALFEMLGGVLPLEEQTDIAALHKAARQHARGQQIAYVPNYRWHASPASMLLQSGGPTSVEWRSASESLMGLSYVADKFFTTSVLAEILGGPRPAPIGADELPPWRMSAPWNTTYFVQPYAGSGAGDGDVLYRAQRRATEAGLERPRVILMPRQSDVVAIRVGYRIWQRWPAGAIDQCERPCAFVQDVEAGHGVGEVDMVVSHCGEEAPAPTQSPLLAKAARVFLCLENINDRFRSGNESLYDVTATHRRDADIPLTYAFASTAPYLNEAESPFPGLGAARTELATAVYSHSGLSWNRTAFLAELAEHIPIHFHGRVLHNMGREDARMDQTEKLTTLYRTHKFVIALENDVAPDYVTEKLWEPLMQGAVPVYYGAPNVEELLPHPDAIVNLRDFGMDTQAVGEYLARVGADADLYARHHAWRRDPAAIARLETVTARGVFLPQAPPRPPADALAGTRSRRRLVQNQGGLAPFDVGEPMVSREANYFDPCRLCDADISGWEERNADKRAAHIAYEQMARAKVHEQPRAPAPTAAADQASKPHQQHYTYVFR